MDTLLAKLNSYHILSNLFPGAIFFNLITLFFGIEHDNLSFITEICIYYFTVIIFNRIGSLVIENICKKYNIIMFSKYKDYIKAVNKDISIYSFVETSDMYRTFLTGFIIMLLILLPVYVYIKGFSIYILVMFTILTLLIVLFFYSYKKQVGYITKRVNHYINEGNIDE